MLFVYSAGGEELHDAIVAIHRQDLDGVPILHLLVRFAVETFRRHHLVLVEVPHQPEGTIVEVFITPVIEEHHRLESVTKTKA